MKTTLVITIFVLLGLGIGLVSWFGKGKQSASPEEPTTIKVAYKEGAVSVPLFVGIDQGFFTNRNLKVEPVVFTSTNQMIQSVISGDVDASSPGVVEAALAAETVSPGKFKIYSQVVMDQDHFMDYVMIRKDSPMTSMSDLKGKKIGVAEGSRLFYEKTVMKNFLKEGEYELHPMAPNLFLSALESGSIDAFIWNEPVPTIAIQKGIAKVLLERPYTDYVPYMNQFSGAALMSTAFIESHPDEAKAFYGAMEDSFEFVRNNPEAAKQLLPSCCGVSEEIAPYIPHLALFSGSAQINKEALQKFADYLFEAGLIEQKVETGQLIYLP